MKKATLYEQLKDNKVRCTACSHYCQISPGKTGVCGVRQNCDGALQLLVYNHPIAVNLDPIEKKPLFHFLPGTQIFSLGTVGCNFGCDFCQNWDISQVSKTDKDFDWESAGEAWLPEDIVNYCQHHGIPAIAYTYNEPTIFIEYAYDIAKLAHNAGIKNVFVTNGYGSAEVYDYIGKYLDAANVDLKSFNPEYYQKICHAKIKPVLENIKLLHERGIWVEVTTLIVPGQNDDPGELTQLAEFIAKIDPNIPWHISRFFPQYKMQNLGPTPLKTLEQAYDIGTRAGLKYIYVGNITDSSHETTICPKCHKAVIERVGYQLNGLNLKDGRCKYCQTKLPGVWK